MHLALAICPLVQIGMCDTHARHCAQKQKPSGVNPEGLIAEAGQFSHRF
jgi:hypothetical protein